MSHKILHLAKDEKFINSANWQFEKAYPNQNEFRIYVLDKSIPLKYVEKKSNIIIYNESQFSDFTKDFENFDLVVLHGLDDIQSTAVLKAPHGVKFLWLLFGVEIYSNSKAPGISILGKLSNRLVLKERIINTLKELVKPIYFTLRGAMPTNIKILKAASQIKFFGVLYEEEYKLLLEQKVLNPEAQLIKFTYYPLEFTFNGIENLSITGNNILVGNSASVSSNHLEAFEILKTFDISDRKIIVPLSYGDNKYANKISQRGARIFGSNFEPLLDFMTLSNYNTKLSECSVVIMNHYRQQAVGTVLAMLWMGAKVYLSERSTLFTYLKRIKIIIYSIETELKKSNNSVFAPLSPHLAEKNKNILLSELSTKNTQRVLKKDLEKIILTDYIE